MRNTALQVLGVGFSVAGLGIDHAKFGFYRSQSFLFIVVIVISILLKTAFSQTSIFVNLWLKFYSVRTRIKPHI